MEEMKLSRHESRQNVWINEWGEADGDLINEVIKDIIKIMIYRDCMPEEGKLRVALAKLIY